MAKISAFLLLGSNLGDRVSYLHQAAGLITKHAGNIAKKSGLYETAPWGNERQPPFLNQAVQIETLLQPTELLHVLKQIETTIGRKQSVRWGARIIDIDILLMDGIRFDSPTLTIPHPQIHKRRFTLAPLAEIASEVKHPVLDLTIKELLQNCEDQLEVTKYEAQEEHPVETHE